MQFKYLGMTIDPRLNFDIPVHISSSATNISRSLSVITNLKLILPRKILRSLYSLMIHPHLLSGKYFGNLGIYYDLGNLGDFF